MDRYFSREYEGMSDEEIGKSFREHSLLDYLFPKPEPKFENFKFRSIKEMEEIEKEMLGRDIMFKTKKL